MRPPVATLKEGVLKMKTTILSIAAAAAITLGTAGAASAAPSAANAGLFDGANAAQTQQVYYGGGWGGWRHHGFRHRRMCRRLYYKGFVLGNPFARRAFYRLCRHRRPFYRY
jgi:hypothetical protein